MLSQHTALKAFLIRLIADSRTSAAEYAPPKTPWPAARNHARPGQDVRTYMGDASGLLPLARVDQRQQRFEHACHDGNHAMRNILSAVPAAEQGALKGNQES